jgi:hypothetical protein
MPDSYSERISFPYHLALGGSLLTGSTDGLARAVEGIPG